MSRRRAPLLVAVAAAVMVLAPTAQAALGGRSSPGRAPASGTPAGGRDTAKADAAATVGLPPAPDDGALLDVDPTDPQIGRVSAPSAARSAASRAPSAIRSGSQSAAADRSATLAPTTLTLTFKTSGYRLFAIPAAARPYAGARAPRVDAKPHDSTGVRKIVYGGRTYDQPVAQAQWGIANLNSYAATKDAFYLRRAVAQAQQIIAARVAVNTSQGAAWFIKYPFDFHLHSGTAFTEKAPWYSAMAQGLAISLFTRLVAANPARAAHWRTAAGAAYRAFLVRSSATTPWVVHADSAGYLWLDEYPVGPRPGQSDLTLNGHLFAAFGLYDYYQLTESADALRLFDGATTTAMRYLETFRAPNWVSRYCLAHGVQNEKYHRVHVAQLRLVYRMTHAGGLARESERFDIDYPSPTIDGIVGLAKGRVTGYKFSSSGALTARRSITLSSASSAPASSRTRVKGRDIYLSISAGALRGYEVAETPGRAYLRGVVTLGVWAPPWRTFAYTASSQLLGLAAGKNVVAREVAHTDRMVLTGGRIWYHIMDGRHAGTYVLYGTVKMDVSVIEG
jgi:D-glucuronyl C5-epimerase C-terminus